MPRQTPTRKSKPRNKFLHRAAGHVFELASVALFSILIVCSFACTAFLASAGLRSTQLAAVVTSVLVDLTNQDRAQNQIDGLTINPLLTEAAQAKANDMATKGYFAHTSPQGLTSWYWFQQAGYSFSYAGENLAVDFTDSDTVNQAWMNSPEHRANILNSHFTDIGIAEAQGVYEGQETTFIVEMFGTPATDAAQADDDVLDEITPAVPTDMAYATTKPQAASSTDVLGTSVAPTAVSAASTRTTTTHQSPIATSSTKAQTAVAFSAPPASQGTPNWLSFFVASPQQLLQTIYFALGAFLLLALIVRTRFEFRIHHMPHVAITLGLLLFMGALLIVADQYVFVQPVLGSSASISI